MNTVNTYDIENLINTNSLGYNLKQVGTIWVINNGLGDLKFDTLEQVKTFLNEEIADRATMYEQGEESVKLDTSKLVIFNSTLNAPIPSERTDKARTKVYQESESNEHAKVKIDQLKIIPTVSKSGRVTYNLPEELSEVGNIKNDFKKVVSKYCLPFSIRASRVLSVHHRDKVEEAKAVCNDRLRRQANLIASKLDDWKSEAKALGTFISDSSWPSKAYFTSSYTCDGVFSKIDGKFDYDAEVSDRAMNSVRETVNDAISSVTEYLNGTAKQFRENSFKNITEKVGVLKDGGLIADKTFNELIDRIQTFADDFDSSALRDAKKRLDRGVVPVTGRRKTAITEDDLSEDLKFVSTALDPLKDLADELEGLI